MRGYLHVLCATFRFLLSSALAGPDLVLQTLVAAICFRMFADVDPFLSQVTLAQGRRSNKRMWHEALCFRSTITPLAMMSHRRSVKCIIPPKQVPVCCVRGTPNLPMPFDRRWYNPRRRKSEFHHPLKPLRRWIQDEGYNHFDYHSKDYFMLISYNILGDNNASKHGELYRNIPLDIMNWNSRKRFIFHEIDSLNGDLLCLQEVDNYEDVSAYLKRKGYIGHYKRRTGWAKDGCALFWKAKRFKLLEADIIEFRSFGLRDNVAQLLVFELSDGNPRRLVVGNIHVLFNPKRGDIKLGQIYRFLLKATQLSEKWGGIPVVLAGDFNSTPKSAIYDFLLTSKLKVDMRNRRKLLEQNNFQFASCDLSAMDRFVLRRCRGMHTAVDDGDNLSGWGGELSSSFNKDDVAGGGDNVGVGVRR